MGRTDSGAAAEVSRGEGVYLNTSISAKSEAVSTQDASREQAGAVSAPLRGLMLLCGAVGACVLAAWVWMIDRQAGEFVLVDYAIAKNVVATLPKLFVFGVIGMIGLGALGFLWALLKDHRLHSLVRWARDWAMRHKLLALLLVVSAVIGSVDVYEFMMGSEPRADKAGQKHIYMLREDVKVWLLFGATIMGALGW